MKPIEFPEQLVVVAKSQPPFLPLPAWQDEKETISCWRLSFRERIHLLFTGKLWVRLMNYSTPPQPLKIQVEYPFVSVKEVNT